MDTVRNADAADSAELVKPVDLQPGLNPHDAFLMAEVILRHRPRPMSNIAELRNAGNTQQRAKVLQNQRQKLLVRHLRQFR